MNLLSTKLGRKRRLSCAVPPDDKRYVQAEVVLSSRWTRHQPSLRSPTSLCDLGCISGITGSALHARRWALFRKGRMLTQLPAFHALSGLSCISDADRRKKKPGAWHRQSGYVLFQLPMKKHCISSACWVRWLSLLIYLSNRQTTQDPLHFIKTWINPCYPSNY